MSTVGALRLVASEGDVQGDMLDGVVSDPVLEVFEFWRVVMVKDRAQLGPKRRQRIREALRIGYSVDDLRLAIVGCKYDNWAQGDNKSGMIYDDIELVCRDETKIDLFMSIGQKYIDKVRAKEVKVSDVAKEQAERIPMPEYVRAKLDALFSKHRKP